MDNRIPPLDSTQADDKQAEVLREALDWLERLASEPEHGVKLSGEEVELLRDYATERGVNVRRLAVEFLLHFHEGPLEWEDFEAWSLDPDGDVRSMVFDAVDWPTRPLANLCLSDKERCAKIIAESVGRYAEGDFELRQLMWESEEWLDVIWPHIGSLIDKAAPGFWSRMTNRLLPEVLQSHGWGPENPHIRPWIEGEQTNRKLALLASALSLWPVEGNLRRIVEALKQDPDPVIAHIATVTLREDTGRMELTLEHYEMVKKRIEEGESRRGDAETR